MIPHSSLCSYPIYYPHLTQQTRVAHMSLPHHSTHTTQLISLLTSGVSQSEAALALGITPGAVSQLVQTPEVARELEIYRTKQLQQSSQIDANYDEIELKLQEQLKRVVPLLMRPGEIAQVLTRINSAKRRGVAHTTSAGPARVLSLNIPVALQAKFVVNGSNQVVEAGNQTLVTMQSSNIAKYAEASNVRSKPSLPTAPPASDTEDEFGL